MRRGGDALLRRERGVQEKKFKKEGVTEEKKDQ
jgi:hypothetical protein